jgi:hypothetical protein
MKSMPPPPPQPPPARTAYKPPLRETMTVLGCSLSITAIFMYFAIFHWPAQ